MPWPPFGRICGVRREDQRDLDREECKRFYEGVPFRRLCASLGTALEFLRSVSIVSVVGEVLVPRNIPPRVSSCGYRRVSSDFVHSTFSTVSIVSRQAGLRRLPENLPHDGDISQT